MKEPKLLTLSIGAFYNDAITLLENLCPDFDDEIMDKNYQPDDVSSSDDDDDDDNDGDDDDVDDEVVNDDPKDEGDDDGENDNDDVEANGGNRINEDKQETLVEDADDSDDDEEDDNALDTSANGMSINDVLKILKEDTRITTRSMQRDESDHWQLLWNEADMDKSLNSNDEEIDAYFDDRIAQYGNTHWSEYVAYTTAQQGRFEINVVIARISQLLDALIIARKDAFLGADLKDENPGVEADFLRFEMHRSIQQLDLKYQQSVALHDEDFKFDIAKPLDRAIVKWRQIRDYYKVSFAEFSPDAMKSVAHIISTSSNFGLKSIFNSFDPKKALELYKGKDGADGQLGRPLLSAYNFFVGETPWGDELHTHIRVLKTFLDRLLVLFVTLAKLKIKGVDFVGFRALCKIHGFEPKEKMFGKGWYFSNLSGDKAVKLLDVIIDAGRYLPQPYRLGVIDIAKGLRPLLALYRSTNPLREFGYDGFGVNGKMQLYNDGIVAPLRLIHRLLGMLFPNIIRYSGVSNKNYCIGWHTRKFEDLIHEHAKQYLSEVA